MRRCSKVGIVIYVCNCVCVCICMILDDFGENAEKRHIQILFHLDRTARGLQTTVRNPGYKCDLLGSGSEGVSSISDAPYLPEVLHGPGTTRVDA